MNDLKHILIDAARYRWARENVKVIRDEIVREYVRLGGFSEGEWRDKKVTPVEFDAAVDRCAGMV